MPKKLVLLSTAAALAICGLFISGAALAAEDDENPFREKEKDERGDRRKMFLKTWRAWNKKKAGKELTAEEKVLLERAQKMRDARARQDEELRRRQQRQPGGPPFAPAGAPTRQGRLRDDERLNVIDSAYYKIAEIHLAKKEYGPAVTALERLIEKTPDELAKSLTHLNLAELYRKELANTKKAVQEYKIVTGEYALDALRRLAQLFEELDQIDEAAREFESIIRNAKDNMQKVLALRELAGLLARSGRGDEAIAALQRLTTSVSYDEARRISKALLEVRDLREKRAQQGQERARLQMMNIMMQRQRVGRAPREREMRPARVRPREPRKKRQDIEPRERPIEPAPDGK